MKPQKCKRAGITVGNMGQNSDEHVYNRLQATDDAAEAREQAKGKGKAREDTPGPVEEDSMLRP